MEKPVLIVELTGYVGKNTSLDVCPTPLFMVIDAITGEELDNGYRSFEEALECWPNAINIESKEVDGVNQRLKMLVEFHDLLGAKITEMIPDGDECNCEEDHGVFEQVHHGNHFDEVFQFCLKCGGVKQ